MTTKILGMLIGFMMLGTVSGCAVDATETEEAVPFETYAASSGCSNTAEMGSSGACTVWGAHCSQNSATCSKCNGDMRQGTPQSNGTCRCCVFTAPNFASPSYCWTSTTGACG